MRTFVDNSANGRLGCFFDGETDRLTGLRWILSGVWLEGILPWFLVGVKGSAAVAD